MMSDCLWDAKPKVWYAVIKSYRFFPWISLPQELLFTSKDHATSCKNENNLKSSFWYKYQIEERVYATYPDNTIDWQYYNILSKTD